jgi:hypothetical protein
MRRMEITLHPNGRSQAGPPHSFVVALPEGATAILDKITGKGWQLTVRHQHGRLTNRGLFGTPYDIQALLQAEYYLNKVAPGE